MRQITYHIHRYQQGRAFVQTFKFDYEPDRTILWGLQKIKDTQDPTLTFLAACRSAVCGACSIRVNGEAMLGCEAKIDELTERYVVDFSFATKHCFAIYANGASAANCRTTSSQEC